MCSINTASWQTTIKFWVILSVMKFINWNKTAQRLLFFRLFFGHIKDYILYIRLLCPNMLVDEPKTPGPVELEQTSQGKVVVSWAPSPDEELDDRLYYVVTQRDSNTRVWKTVADRLFTHTYTANNILSGNEYHFRIYAKNDMGLSDPSQSPTWGVNSNKGTWTLVYRVCVE